MGVVGCSRRGCTLTVKLSRNTPSYPSLHLNRNGKKKINNRGRFILGNNVKSLGESIFSYRRSIIYSRSCRLQRCTTLPDYHVSQIRSCTRRCKNRCSNNRKKKKKKKNSFNVIRYNKSRKNRFHPAEIKVRNARKRGKKEGIPLKISLYE